MGSTSAVPTPNVLMPRPTTWFGRNWKWFVPVLAGLGLVLLCAFVFGLFSLINSMFRNSYPYKVAMDRANASIEVADRIGNPFKVGWLMTGSINYSGPEGNAAFNIPITGAKGRGTIVVVAKKHANRWTFETLEVDVEGQDNPIPLLGQPSPAARPPSSDST
jgi:hypothetical protein